MSHRLIGAKPLFDPLLTYCHLGHIYDYMADVGCFIEIFRRNADIKIVGRYEMVGRNYSNNV